MTTWRPPISHRDDGDCPLRRLHGSDLVEPLRSMTGLSWQVDGNTATGPRHLTLHRDASGWLARWRPPWSVAGWVGRSTTAPGALRALADVLDNARTPGHEKYRDRVRRSITRAKEATCSA